MPLPRVHLVVGTRPEAIKMAPLVDAMRREGVLEPVVVATGQHPTMVVQALAAFAQRPDVTLRPNRRTGEQSELIAELSPALDEVLVDHGSAAVVVQGDTTSALIGGLVGFWRRVPVVHLEAGLRSGDIDSPFPEEANRRLLATISSLHLAPTPRAAGALLAEGVDPTRVLVVGNTVVDAVLTAAAGLAPFGDPRLTEVDRLVALGRCRLLLVTAHRRESWGRPLDRVLDAVREIVDGRPDLWCVLPAHANPAVRAQVDRALASHPRVVVTDPLPYPVLCRLLACSSLVLSDSGGIQEEAPSFRVPVLVLREVTERMEAIEGGWARLVGTDTANVVASAKEVLDGRDILPHEGNPFGDGQAADRSARAVAWLLGDGRKPIQFSPSRGAERTAGGLALA